MSTPTGAVNFLSQIRPGHRLGNPEAFAARCPRIPWQQGNQCARRGLSMGTRTGLLVRRCWWIWGAPEASQTSILQV